MEKKIKEFAKKLNIEFCGIAPVMRYEELEARILARREKYGVSDFEEKEIEKRVDPLLTFPWAKSIVVCLFPYYTGESEKSNISRYARIPDYHRVAKNKLSEIAEFMKKNGAGKCECFSDTGVLHDRYLAHLAGLGFFGLNTCLINEKYGSYFFIGYIVTDMSLPHDVPLDKKCDMCFECVKKCPGQALDGEFHLNTGRCVSYITQQKDITKEQREILNSQSKVFGCDACQEICPHNRSAVLTPVEEFYEFSLSELDKNELTVMSNREFKEKYGQFPFSWRGKAVILKNFDK